MHARGFVLVVTACLTTAIAFGIMASHQADAQQAAPASQESTGSVPNNGQDFTRPQNLFQLRYTYRTAPGSGSESGTIRTVTSDIATLRADFAVGLTPQWTLAFRNDLPLVAKDPITSGNPSGDYLYGLGDADTQAALIRELDTRTAAGAGLRLIMPTGRYGLSSGKWQFMPVAGFRYSLPEVSAGSYFEPLARYDFSFAGLPSAHNISNLQLAPMLNIALPDRWFVTFYPDTDIRINYGDPVTGQTGRLFLPADFMVGRAITKDITMSLEIGVPIVKDYPVYDFKTTTRFNMKF